MADVAKLALLVDVDQLPVLAHGESVVATRGEDGGGILGLESEMAEAEVDEVKK